MADDPVSLLCYAGTGYVHLTHDGRATLCGETVYDAPELPRAGTPPLSCLRCYEAEYGRAPVEPSQVSLVNLHDDEREHE